MRMWLVNPRVMCRQHLLGEHLELHMFVGHIALGRKVDGYVSGNLLESASIQARHEALVAEMERRGYAHRSPLRYADTLRAGKIDRRAAKADLFARCALCRGGGND